MKTRSQQFKYFKKSSNASKLQLKNNYFFLNENLKYKILIVSNLFYNAFLLS